MIMFARMSIAIFAPYNFKLILLYMAELFARFYLFLCLNVLCWLKETLIQSIWFNRKSG